MCPEGGTSAQGPTVVVVDDDADLLAALRFSLELDGLRVITHRSAETVAVDDLPRTNACLVLDYRLPGQDGLDLLVSLREAGVTLPAILVTSHAAPTVRHQARSVGAVLLEKPLLGDALVTAIHAVLTRP
ncbi:MAG: response regulator [Caulobacter sp.]|nr:response regulator [Caulobacter sp.]